MAICCWINYNSWEVSDVADISNIIIAQSQKELHH